MAGNNSLLNYNKKQAPFTGSGNVSNNFNRNHTATQKPMDGWRGGTDYNNVWSYAQKYNTTDWNKNYTRDPLANFGSSSNKGASFATILSGIMMGLTGVTAALGLFGTLKELFGSKKNAAKEAASPQNFNADAKTSLDDISNTASSYDDNSKVSDMEDTSTTLGNAITSSQAQRDNYKRDAETARKTKENLEGQRPALVNALQSFDTEKQTLETNISTVEGKLNNPDLSEADKASLKAEIAQMKKQLQEKYSDSKRKELADRVTENARGITAQEKAIAENDAKANQLNEQIKSAEKAKKALDRKIAKKHND